MIQVLQKNTYHPDIESKIISAISNYLNADKPKEAESKEFSEIIPIVKVINKLFWKLKNLDVLYLVIDQTIKVESDIDELE